jgi:SAM-dependent methyltransferase
MSGTLVMVEEKKEEFMHGYTGIAKPMISASLRLAKRSPRLAALVRNVVDSGLEQLLSLVEEDNDFAVNDLDRIYTAYRRKLQRTKTWRYGPERVKEVAGKAIRALAAITGIEGKVYLDLGCGAHNPFGSSTVMFVNGASATVAIDMAPTDDRRAAEAIFDLLADCWTTPEDWHCSDISRSDFLARMSRFNLGALKNGDLEKGLAEIPMKHLVTDFLSCSIPDMSVDLVSSRTVLEHFLDFPVAVQRLFSIVAPGGVAFHEIDLRDHRCYRHPERFHPWSFLAEEEDWSDGLCNRLRAGEVKTALEQVGFDILKFLCEREKMPTNFKSQCKGRFARMSDEELEVTSISCVLRKPA